MSERDEGHVLRGPIDRAALITVRDLINEEEPLASATLDEFLNPTTLEVAFEDGLCEAETARIDIQWTIQNDYKYHYTDSTGVDLRWGRHPHDGDYSNVSGLAHYHPPPDGSSKPAEVEGSRITQSTEVLVTRAILTLWRVAYHEESLRALDTGHNPP
jgi:hypothetical protein